MMKHIIIALALLSVMASGCKKKNLPVPEEHVMEQSSGFAALSGTIDPIGAVEKVLIVNTVRDVSSVGRQAVPDDKGNFSFSELPPGNYSLLFVPVHEFSLIPEMSVELSAAHLRKLGVVHFAKKQPGSIRGAIAPVEAATAVTLTATVDGSLLSFKSVVDSKGAFAFQDLPDANYVVGYDLAADYVAPDVKYANVVKGLAIDMGRIELASFNDCGLVKGKLLPAGTVAHVLLRGIGNSGYNFSTAADPLSGDFLFQKVPKGSYTLSCTSVSGMITPYSRAVIVNAGASLDVGALSYAPNLLLSLVSCRVNDALISWTKYTNSYSGILNASFRDRVLTIDCASPVGTPESRGRQLRIALDNVEGPGTYVCKNTPASFIGYVDNAPSFLVWPSSSSINNGAAKVIITEVDAVQKTIKGTFSATLFGASSSIKKDLTDGAFKVSYK